MLKTPKIYCVRIGDAERYFQKLDPAFTMARKLADLSAWDVEIQVVKRLTKTSLNREKAAALLNGESALTRAPKPTILADEVILRVLGVRRDGNAPSLNANLRLAKFRPAEAKHE